MSGLNLIADGVLIALLGAALISVFRLNRRLNEMREGRAGLEKLTADLAKQTGMATDGLTALRANAETLGRDLDGRSDRGRQVMAELQKASDDLRLLIGRADKAAERLESAIAKARAHEAAGAAMERQQVADAERQPERISPEKAALLSQLSGIR
jgi:septal ring factor EnvC (AmiA/AmiB activator)